MARANRTALLYESPVNAGLSVRDPLSVMIEETDLVAILTFFDLLAEWESKEANDANLNQG